MALDGAIPVTVPVHDPLAEPRGHALVISLNAGSSSLKFAAHDVDARVARPRFRGAIAYGDDGAGRLSIGFPDDGTSAVDRTIGGGPDQALAAIAELLDAHRLAPPLAFGHRIVHGGPRLVRHARIDAGVLATLEGAVGFAPVHMPVALELLAAARTRYPRASHVACLDTAFHADLPAVARTLPLPSDVRALGVHRYGFHGLSCESIVHQLGAGLRARTVIAHLGSGASITAVRDGASVDTSMGFTPAGGTVMGTRCGDIDPGVLAWLMRERGFDARQIEELVDHRGGLLGVSGLSADLRTLHAAARDVPDARLAIELFVRSVSQHVAARTVALGGLDMLVFTGGIGEHDAVVRDAICGQLAFLGVERSGGAGTCVTRVLRTDEESVMARHAYDHM